MAEFAVKARGLGKQFRKGSENQGRLIESFRRRGGYEYFWALRDVSLDVEKGELFGIIGRNGAGKSTLLRILSRITRPDEGYAEIYGRVGTLLDVGTGFHPELTGRENIYLNGALIGIARSEIRRKFDEIVDFSGVEEFIDTPLKRYSSGMQVRLGFAVAVNLPQEIMLVDEVLSVGDAAFREKCLNRITEVVAAGRTVLFVGHNMEMIGSTCDRALWLEKGKAVAVAPAREVAQAYQENVLAEDGDQQGFTALHEKPDDRTGSGLRLTHVRLLDREGVQVPYFGSGRSVKLAIGYEVQDHARLSDVTVGVTIFNQARVALASCENTCVGRSFSDLPAKGEFICEFDRLPIMPGRYSLGIRCKVGDVSAHTIPNAARFRVVPGEFYPTGALPAPGSGSLLIEYRWSVSDSAS